MARSTKNDAAPPDLPIEAKENSEHLEDLERKGVVDNPRAHLQPRPSEDPKDPLNWPINLKVRNLELSRSEL
jgi:hypothetical protein